MSLTPKQEAFCIAYIECGNASEAYRRSYDAGSMTATSVNRKAKELLDNGKIAARLAELRAPAVERAQVTLESHLTELQRLRDAAYSAEKFGPAIQAEIARGKASGLYVDKVEHSGTLNWAGVLQELNARAAGGS
jgi:phage terminase small subunit